MATSSPATADAPDQSDLALALPVGSCTLMPKDSATDSHLLRLRSGATDFTIPPVTIQVEVDHPPLTFYVNEAMIRSTSKFFDKALNAEWEEGQKHTVKLPDCNSASFDVYINWLHSGRLFMDDGKKGEDSHIWDVLAKAYILGDKLLDGEFKDALCDAATEKTQALEDGNCWIFGIHTRRLIYENTVTGAPLRRLLVQRLCTLKRCAEIVQDSEPPALLYDVSQELLRTQCQATGEEFNRQAKACAFHEHAEGAKNCYRNNRR